LIPHTSVHIKQLGVKVSIPIIAKDIAIIKMLVTGGGHLEFYHEKVDKNGNSFTQFFRVNINEKAQLFKIYMKKSQNMYLLHTSVYYKRCRIDIRRNGTVLLITFSMHKTLFYYSCYLATRYIAHNYNSEKEIKALVRKYALSASGGLYLLHSLCA